MNEIKHLEKSYKKGENMFGIPDHNHKIVAQYMRMRMLHPSIVKEEFDNTLQENKKIIDTPLSVFDKDFLKIKNMSEKEKEAFRKLIYYEEGYTLRENGGLHRFRKWFTENVSGFAIEHNSLNFLITNRFGKHLYAREKLKQNIVLASTKNDRKDKDIFEYSSYIFKNIVYGLIFTNIGDIKTPILRLHLFDSYLKDNTKIVNYLKKQKRYIVIDDDENLL